MATVPARFIHVGFVFSGPEKPIDALGRTFAKALDWMRYSTECWILYSTTDTDTWRDRIRRTPGVLESDAFFVCDFDNYSGYMHDWVWEWLRKDRSSDKRLGTGT
jgi:hypothetical protein